LSAAIRPRISAGTLPIEIGVRSSGERAATWCSIFESGPSDMRTLIEISARIRPSTTTSVVTAVSKMRSPSASRWCVVSASATLIRSPPT
jgi:hypothetical protein